MTQQRSPSAGSYTPPVFKRGGRPELRKAVVWLDGIVAALGDQLEGRDDLPEVRERQVTFIGVREEVLALANGAPLTEYGFQATCFALGELHSGKVLPPMEYLDVIGRMKLPRQKRSKRS